jgi:hypothetical protein
VRGSLALTTTHNIGLLRERLGDDAEKVEFVESREWLTTPEYALREFRAFCDRELRDGAHWLRFVAEPIWKGRPEADLRRWTRFESLLNVLFRDSPLTLVCSYDERLATAEILRDVQQTHPLLLGEDGVSKSAAYAGPGWLALNP